jgi:tripartite-type tricarboxylate transporter receptor subunit TctC
MNDLELRAASGRTTAVMALLVAGMAAASGVQAQAPSASAGQAYPAKAVRLVVAFPPGGGIDTVTRLLGPRLTEALGQQMVIENRVGASGNIGTDFVAKSAPDGYTVLMAYASHASNAALFDKLPYDTVRDFHGVSLIGAVPHIVLVNPSLPVKTVPELLKLAKARPGDITYSSPGNGTPLHLAVELLKVSAGVDLRHIPYKGASPAMVSTMSGETQLTITTTVVATPLAKSGRLRAIAVASEKRVATFPALPTVAESGIKGTESNSWYGMLVPAATPRPIVDRLNAEIRKAMADPAVAANLASQTLDPMPMSPEEFAKFIKSDYDKLADVVRIAGARIE